MKIKSILFVTIFTLMAAGFVFAEDPGKIPDIFGYTYSDDAQIRMGKSEDFVCEYDTGQTPDSEHCGVSSDSNGLVISEKADMGFDFAHAKPSDPTIFVHSHNQSTSQWISLSHDGTNGVVDVGTGVVSFPDGISAAVTGNASTATALAANPSDCASDTYATSIAASGDLTCGAITDAGVTNALTISGGTVNNSIIGGSTPAAATVTTLVANTSISTAGTIKSSSATGAGAHKLSGANTACNTTCSSGGCLFGFDLAAGASQPVMVECADATADTCLCLQ